METFSKSHDAIHGTQNYIEVPTYILRIFGLLLDMYTI